MTASRASIDSMHIFTQTRQKFLRIVMAVAAVTWSLSGSIALAAAPTVSAGSPKTIALPAKDVTLFGRATDPEGDDLVVTWTGSGPGSVSLSAPWALTTSVSFSQPGSYSFRLTVSDGGNVVTSDTTVQVLAAESQTAFYVDPTYTGTESDGSASRPWKSLATDYPTDARWTAINNALASNNVIVYFSARRAGSDASEVETKSVNIFRTNQSTNRLTLDGMSKYNANDAAPSWVANTGSTLFHIAITSGPMSIGVQTVNTSYPMHYTTVRGFELSGASGRALIAGNATVFEYNHVHDVTAVGATVQFQAAVRDYPVCTALFGNLRDITFRSNLIERGEGESLYIAGTYTRERDGGCPAWGNTHSDILIEGNTIGEAGNNGGEHDGIDLKAGLVNVTVRANLISNRPAGARAIVTLGLFYSPGTCCIGNYLIEGNLFRGNAAESVLLQKQNGAVVRNNVSDRGGWMATSGDDNTGYWISEKVSFYNNTLYSGGIVTYYVNRVSIMNNILLSMSSYPSIQGNSTGTNATEDYNLFDVDPAQMVSGGHSLRVSSSGLFANVSAGDLQLSSSSAARSRGANLSRTGFAIDFGTNARQTGSAWDVGAFTYGGSSTASTPGGPSPPPNVRIVP